MGKFEKYVGKTEFKVDGEEISLDFTVEDKMKLMSIQEMKEKDYDKLCSLLLATFKRSYPGESEESIKAFIGKKFEVIIPELFIALNLTTREDIEKAIQKAKEDFLKGKAV